MVETRQLPPLPEIGHPEAYYARKVRDADRSGNLHAHEAAKVGQYVTLATNPHLEWEQKLRYFQHALRRHCIAPPLSAEPVWLFYAQLADLVRRYCGQEALRLACREDDRWAELTSRGGTPARIEDEAEVFFSRIMGNQSERPTHFNDEDWSQLKLLRNQWI